MEQQFVLKYHGKVDIWEQNNMTGEERSWWIKRIQEEIERQNKAMERNSGN